jgi:uncharacterized protein DUF4157
MMGMPQVLRSRERRGIARRAPETRRQRTFVGRPDIEPKGPASSILESQRLRGNASTAVLTGRRVARFGANRGRSDGAGVDVSPLVQRALQVPGKRLDADIRSTMEPAFGKTLDDVRVHEGGAAGATADSMGAAAYAVGRHIVFGGANYSPETQPGRQLLAHELAHVSSSRPGEEANASRSVLGPARDPQEQAADAAAKAAVTRVSESRSPTPSPLPVAAIASAGAAVVRRSPAGDILGAAAGALAGTALGFLAGGPIGAIIGGVTGGAGGLLAGEFATAGERPLDDRERTAAKLVFGASLNLDRVRIAESPILGAGGFARTPFETVYFPPEAQQSAVYLPWLIHELTHVWQTQHGVSVVTKTITALRGPIAYFYGGKEQLVRDAAAGKKFTDYNTEQQADILADYYTALTLGLDVSAYEPFVAQVTGSTTEERSHVPR